MQPRQGGVLFHGLGQRLGARDTWLEKRDEAHSTHHTPKLQKDAKSLPIVLLSKLKVLGSKTRWNDQSRLIIDTMPCRLLCTIFDWSPNSSHWKVIKQQNIIQRTISNSLRFARLRWHIWDSKLRYIAFRHFTNVTFIRPCLDLSFLHCFTALLHSWHHRHPAPSLSPFNSDVVELQMQPRQGGVLFHGLGQGLAGDTWLEKHDEAHSTHHPANMRKSPCSSSSHLKIWVTHSARATYCLAEKVASLYIQLLPGTFLGQSFHLIFDDPEHVRSY